MNMIYLVAGARPNFMKLAPIVRALDRHAGQLSYRIVHTGQHYDREMSAVFFEELGIPTPAYHMEAGGGSHAQQTAKIMVAFEQLCQKETPDAVMVVGDVNSTLACSIVAKKLCIPVAHVEAGLRSGDRAMPEEINRLVTDAIADWFFVTEPSGRENLLAEGKAASAVYSVGNVMVDNLFFQQKKLLCHPLVDGEGMAFKRLHGKFGVVTLHRPSNVDRREVFLRLANGLRTISQELPLVFPVHPRTRSNMEKFGIDLGTNVTLLLPLPYMDFLNLWKDATIVLTDSGGLQEETTALGIPCITLRENTERPVTITEGSNTLAGTDEKRIVDEARRILRGEGKQGHRPELWDGRSAERIVKVLLDKLVQLKDMRAIQRCSC
jgi:UDP-N-acetylglucosamine 2-epimerase (non-hydrolysing)